MFTKQSFMNFEEAIAAFREYLSQTSDRQTELLNEEAGEDERKGSFNRLKIFNKHLDAFRQQAEHYIRDVMDHVPARTGCDPEDLERELNGFYREAVLDFLCRNYDRGG